MREFCKVLRDMVDEGKSDDDINSTVNDMTEQVSMSHSLCLCTSVSVCVSVLSYLCMFRSMCLSMCVSVCVFYYLHMHVFPVCCLSAPSTVPLLALRLAEDDHLDIQGRAGCIRSATVPQPQRDLTAGRGHTRRMRSAQQTSVIQAF